MNVVKMQESSRYLSKLVEDLETKGQSQCLDLQKIRGANETLNELWAELNMERCRRKKIIDDVTTILQNR